MRCLVLGGAGFIGSHIVDALVARGHSVRVFCRSAGTPSNLTHCLDSIELSRGDFTSVVDVGRALKGVEVLVHLICSVSPKSSNEDIRFDVETNVLGSVQLLSLAQAHGVKKVIFASSGGTVYGETGIFPISETNGTEPGCSYGVTKLMIEKYLALFERLHGLDYVIIRPANPYGERQNPLSGMGAVTAFLWKTLNQEPITIWGDGTVARDYFHVSDLARLFVHVIENPTQSRIYNAGSGTAQTLNQILMIIRSITGMQPMVKYTAGRECDVPVSYLDTERARRELAWTPQVSLDDGIHRTLAWLREQKHDAFSI